MVWYRNKRRLALLALFLVVIAAGTYLIIVSMSKGTITETLPRIIQLDRYKAVISWETDKPVVGEVTYVTAGGTEKVEKEETKTTSHSVTISGLMPETNYNYWLSGKGEKFYSFRTAPMPETAFRFVVYNGEQTFNQNNSKGFIDTINTQLPEFVILTGKLSNKDYISEEKAFFENTKFSPRMPVYVSPADSDLNNAESQKYYQSFISNDSNGYDFTFEYGNSKFICLGPEIKAGQAVAYEKDRVEWINEIVSMNKLLHVFVVLTSSDTGIEVVDAIAKLGSDKKIAAVIYSGKEPVSKSLSGLKVVEMKDGFITIDVDGEGVSGTAGKYGSKETTIVTINETPESVKRSCVYCRKLLDTQKYEESLQWYRDFIVKYGEKYMVDDAQFEIANIYDRYLFDYSNALKEYKILIEKYPNSNKVQQSINRVEYLNKYSDFDFMPLKIFETAKSQTYQEDRKKAISEVEVIINDYPGSKIEPDVLFWLGHSIAQDESGNIEEPDVLTWIWKHLDEADMERAANYYNILIEKYSDDKKDVQDAWIAKGDLYYQYRQYNKAIDSYDNALKSSESTNYGIVDKIDKCYRNINRDRAFIVISILLILILIAALVIRPRWLTPREIKFAIYLCLLYLALGFIVWAMYCRDYPELIKLIPVLSIFASLVPVVSNVFSRKIFSRMHKALGIILSVLSSAVLSAGVLYAIFYIFHYLPVFGI